jgi:O-antigen/teichoic acid export membrane protein
MTTVRGIGAVIVLLWVSRTISAYFIWQGIAFVLHVIILTLATWRAMPRGTDVLEQRRAAAFRSAELSRIWRFTAALSGISVLGLVLTQADKIVLSKMLPLDRFAYYNVAWSIAAGLLLVSVPLFEAVFPRLSALTAADATDALRRTYHASMQLSTILVVPAAAVLVVFSREVATVWLHDAHAATETYRLIGLLAVGTAANVVMTIPFALQLAAGWTRLSLYKNVIALLVAIPLLLFTVSRYGAVGAASVWIAVNVGYLLFELPVMHRRLLRGALGQVYLRDIGAPSVLAVAAALMTRALASALALPALPSIGIAALLAMTCAVAASPLAVKFARALTGRRTSSVAVG